MRCVLEMVVAVWVPGLTQAESMPIEMVHKCALHVILCNYYESYDTAVRTLEVENLLIDDPSCASILQREHRKTHNIKIGFIQQKKSLNLLTQEVTKLFSKITTDRSHVGQTGTKGLPSHT